MGGGVWGKLRRRRQRKFFIVASSSRIACEVYRTEPLGKEFPTVLFILPSWSFIKTFLHLIIQFCVRLIIGLISALYFKRSFRTISYLCSEFCTKVDRNRASWSIHKAWRVFSLSVRVTTASKSASIVPAKGFKTNPCTRSRSQKTAQLHDHRHPKFNVSLVSGSGEERLLETTLLRQNLFTTILGSVLGSFYI